MKAVILARVSTVEQEAGHSIDAQISRLREYCQRKELEVVKEFTIIESSTQGNRKEFTEMVDFVLALAKKSGGTVAIVADAVDRIQRSFKESIQLEDPIKKGKLALHFMREGMVIDKDVNAMQMMMWNFSVLGANSYVLQLSENVKRSINHKLQNGEIICKAPVGYLNVKNPVTGKSDVMVDTERAFLVKRLFEEYATGTSSFGELEIKAKQWGLTNNTKRKPLLSRSVIALLIQNPFYYGQMWIARHNRLYDHKYQPLISKELFDRCQEIRTGYRKTPFRNTHREFVFKGLLKCAVSGKRVTPDIKKGKYVYLICNNPEQPEKKLWVKEADILKQVEDVLKTLSIPQNVLEGMEHHLRNSFDAEKAYHHAAIASLEKESGQMQEKLDTLLECLLDKSITRDTYDKKQKELKHRQYAINLELADHHKADDSFRTTVSTLLTVASQAYDKFRSSKIEQKRQLIAFVFSNLRLNGAKLEYSLKKPFCYFPEINSCTEWLPFLHMLRTECKEEILLFAAHLPAMQRALSGE